MDKGVGREMKIQLNDKFRIVGVPMNFVLEEKKTIIRKGEKFGTEYWDVAGYYSNFESLLAGLLRRGVQESECEDVNLLIQEVKDGVRAIVAQIKLLEGEGLQKKCKACGKETNKPSGFCGALCQQDYLCETAEEMRGEKEEGTRKNE
jgi:hypothetical protein